MKVQAANVASAVYEGVKGPEDSGGKNGGGVREMRGVHMTVVLRCELYPCTYLSVSGEGKSDWTMPHSSHLEGSKRLHDYGVNTDKQQTGLPCRDDCCTVCVGQGSRVRPV